MKKKRILPTSPKEAIDEAKNYFINAKDILNKSSIEYGIYKKQKYVKEASAMCYLSALRAIDSYLLLKGVKPDKLPTSIEEYLEKLGKIPHNGKLTAALVVVYQNLHIFGYYRGGVSVEMIKDGFAKAKELIDTFDKIING